MKAFAFSFFNLLLLSAAFAQTVPIDNFYEVSPGIYRGARPKRVGLEALKRLGIKTVLNIDDDTRAIEMENRVGAQLKLKTISLPLSSYWYPDDRQVNRILATLSDKNNYPIFLHCKHGQDRTGMIVGLYRVEYENWDPQKAYREMHLLGFHKILYLLYAYFEARTGL